MSNLNFWSMLRDCNLQSDLLSTAQLDIIFTRADLDDEGSRNQSLDPNDYVEALVRIASAHAATKKGATGPGVTAEGISEALTSLLEGTLTAKAGRSDADAFRVSLQEPAVRDVFRVNRDQLRSLFAKYAAADLSATSRMRTMNFKEFGMMLQNGNLLGGGLTTHVVARIFASVQNDGDVKEMDYAEFLESLAACACYRDADPYATLQKKISTFIEGKLIPSLAPPPRSSLASLSSRSSMAVLPRSSMAALPRSSLAALPRSSLAALPKR
jgi:hypothetical protein